MIVSETVGAKGNRERKPVGSVEIHTPTLTEIAKIIVDAKETGKDEKDGLPIYDTAEANWVFGAIHANVKAQARNKLEIVNGTVVLKEGLSIADNVTALSEEGLRGGNGEGLAIVREAKAAFGTWVATLGKTPATEAYIVTMFGNRQALATQPNDRKERIAKYVEEFAATLTDEQLDRFTRPLEAVSAACVALASIEDATDF